MTQRAVKYTGEDSLVLVEGGHGYEVCGRLVMTLVPWGRGIVSAGLERGVGWQERSIEGAVFRSV